MYACMLARILCMFMRRFELDVPRVQEGFFLIFFSAIIALFAAYNAVVNLHLLSSPVPYIPYPFASPCLGFFLTD